MRNKVTFWLGIVLMGIGLVRLVQKAWTDAAVFIFAGLAVMGDGRFSKNRGK